MEPARSYFSEMRVIELTSLCLHHLPAGVNREMIMNFFDSQQPHFPRPTRIHLTNETEIGRLVFVRFESNIKAGEALYELRSQTINGHRFKANLTIGRYCRNFLDSELRGDARECGSWCNFIHDFGGSNRIIVPRKRKLFQILENAENELLSRYFLWETSDQNTTAEQSSTSYETQWSTPVQLSPFSPPIRRTVSVRIEDQQIPVNPLMQPPTLFGLMNQFFGSMFRPTPFLQFQPLLIFTPVIIMPWQWPQQQPPPNRRHRNRRNRRNNNNNNRNNQNTNNNPQQLNSSNPTPPNHPNNPPREPNSGESHSSQTKNTEIVEETTDQELDSVENANPNETGEINNKPEITHQTKPQMVNRTNNTQNNHPRNPQANKPGENGPRRRTLNRTFAPNHSRFAPIHRIPEPVSPPPRFPVRNELPTAEELFAVRPAIPQTIQTDSNTRFVVDHDNLDDEMDQILDDIQRGEYSEWFGIPRR